jgi:hypothetical protein
LQLTSSTPLPGAAKVPALGLWSLAKTGELVAAAAVVDAVSTAQGREFKWESGELAPQLCSPRRQIPGEKRV